MFLNSFNNTPTTLPASLEEDCISSPGDIPSDPGSLFDGMGLAGSTVGSRPGFWGLDGRNSRKKMRLPSKVLQGPGVWSEASGGEPPTASGRDFSPQKIQVPGCAAAGPTEGVEDHDLRARDESGNPSPQVASRRSDCGVEAHDLGDEPKSYSCHSLKLFNSRELLLYRFACGEPRTGRLGSEYRLIRRTGYGTRDSRVEGQHFGPLDLVHCARPPMC